MILIKIDGTSLSLTGWAIFLRISRQRAHQLYHAGILADHVRMKKEKSAAVFEQWKEDRRRKVK
jgi:hypothetical protein